MKTRKITVKRTIRSNGTTAVIRTSVSSNGSTRTSTKTIRVK